MTVSEVVAAPSASPGEHRRHLPANILSGAEVLAQSVANMTPTAAIAITPLLVFLSAGNGTWLSFAVAVLLMGAVAYCASQFARSTNSSASVYAWVKGSLGPRAGYMAGLGLMLGYVLLGSVTILAFETYGNAFLTGLGLSPADHLAHGLLYAIGFAGPLAMSVRGIRLSARAALVLELASVVVVAVLCVATYVHQGSPFDHAQLGLSGVRANGLVVGVVLAVFACVGFESAASLGREARDPNRHVTRAIAASCALVGLFYLVVAYSTVFGFQHVKGGLGAQAAPLPALAGVVGLAWLGHVVSLAIAASTFGGTIACLNAGARMCFTFAGQGYAPRALSLTGRAARTPAAATYFIGAPMVGLPVAWSLAGSSPVNLMADMGTLATFGFMLAYVLVCLGAARCAGGTAGHRARIFAAAATGSLGMAFVFYASSWPQLISNDIFPPLAWPVWVLPYVFAVWALAGLGWYAVAGGRARPGPVS